MYSASILKVNYAGIILHSIVAEFGLGASQSMFSCAEDNIIPPHLHRNPAGKCLLLPFQSAQLLLDISTV